MIQIGRAPGWRPTWTVRCHCFEPIRRLPVLTGGALVPRKGPAVRAPPNLDNDYNSPVESIRRLQLAG
eukprot:2135040-Pyramimonas_sp.AAC.1